VFGEVNPGIDPGAGPPAAPLRVSRRDPAALELRRWRRRKKAQGRGSGRKACRERGGKDKHAAEHWFAILNGEVHTGTGSVLRGATVLARNGKITAIGYDVFVPPDAKTLDAHGLLVYPGIVAISSSGLLGLSSSDLEDTVDPFNPRMTLALAAGITSTGMSSTAAKLKRFSVDGVVMRATGL
jgi:hypothetical protein